MVSIIILYLKQFIVFICRCLPASVAGCLGVRLRSMLLVVFVHHFFSDNVGIYLLSIVGMLVIPDSEIFSGGAQEQNLIHKIISTIGTESIGIYILSSKIISGVCYSIFSVERVNYMLDTILTVGILALCHVAIYIIKKVPLANKMLLGGI